VAAKETLIQAAAAAGWREEHGCWKRPEVTELSGSAKKRGIGVACVYKNVGFPFGFEDTSTAGVVITIDERGSISDALVKSGAVDVGQGVTTALAQIAAESLGIPMSRVRMATVDTSEAPDAGSSSASRHVYASGNAVRRACLAALEDRERILRTETGETSAVGHAVYRARELRPTTGFDPESGQCNPHVSYSYGTEIALVEVDTETGETEVVKLWAAVNAGRVVNPATFYGQVAGGIQMGVGYALTEEFVQKEGRAQTRRFSEYFMPTVLDMPGELVSLAVEVADPTGPFGASGMGETPALPTAPAILNAIHDATGVWLDRTPATSERIWRALRETRPKAS
jgi:CO/xanthine dehydrogenase Mo-binding subunit